MKRSLWRRVGWGIGIAAIAWGLLTIEPSAGDAAPAAEEAKPASKAVAAKGKGKRGPRLPAYFAAVVTEEQRAKVLEAQAEFTADIQAKRKELNSLIDQRDTALMKLLKPEQRKAVEQARAEAKARRAAASAERKSAAEAAAKKAS